MRHRFVDHIFPSPIGTAAMYACVCGRRGTREAIELHVAGAEANADDFDDAFGGDTEAHYLPNEPRVPAPSMTPEVDARDSGESWITARDGTELHRGPSDRRRHPTPQPLPPVPSGPHPVVEIAPSVGHERGASIAEAFQDMLRQAFDAGISAAASGETFETWYQREVLR